MILNKIPSTSPQKGIDFRSLFFSPRDMEYLENYIDTAEFNCFDKDNVYNWHEFKICYKAWFKKKDWLGLLEEINEDVQIPIPVSSMMPNFVERRNQCGGRCFLEQNCNHCQNAIELAQSLFKKGILLKKTKGKNLETTTDKNDI